MTLPTTLSAIQAGTPTDHAAWHNEIDTLVPFLGLPTVTTGTLSGHPAAHDTLHHFVGGGLPLDITALVTLGHDTHHLAVHQYLTTTPVTSLTTANDVQAALTAGATGAVFGLAAGTYRITTALNPKTDQTLYLAYGAVISGSVVLGTWTAAGSDWWATRAAGTLANQPDPGDGRCAITGCENPNDVFYDGIPLVRVASLAALAPGKFFEDFALSRVYIRDVPSGHLVEQAVSRRLVQSANAGVKLRNGTFQHAACQAQQGAIEADGNNWLIEYCEVRYNHGMNVRTDGTGCVVRNCRLHHSNQLGIGGSNCHDAVVEYCEIDHDNRDGLYDAGWEAGASKWTRANRSRIRNNYVHDIKGLGLWHDIDCGNTIIEYNYVADCDQGHSPGIYYEISYGEVTLGDGLKTHIRYNTVVRCAPTSTTGFYGGGQIVVSASPDCEVYGNFAYGRDGIGGQAQLRTDDPDARGAHEIRNLHIYNNDITTTGGGWALCAGVNCDNAAMKPGIWTTWGISFEGNTHHAAGGTGSHWDWSDGARTFATWQGTYGHDTPSGSFDGTIPSVPAPPALVVGPRKPGVTFRRALGINPDQSAATITSDLNHLESVGAQMLWLVFDVSWASTGSGTWDSNAIAKYDEVISQARARGMRIALQAHGMPTWITTASGHAAGTWHGPDTAGERTNWTAALHNFLARYAADTFEWVQIWNEPNISEFWVQGPNADLYARLLQSCYVDLKTSWPNLKIVGHNMSRNDIGWLNAVYAATDTAFTAPTAAANKYYFDVLGIHPYCGNSTSGYAPTDESHADEGGFGGGGLDPDYLGYRRLRQAVFAKEGTNKTLAFGEFGYAVSGSGWFLVSEANRAAYLPSAVALARADGYVEFLNVYYHRIESVVDYWTSFNIHATSSETAFATA